MNLIYFTNEAYKQLKKDADLNKDNYYSDEPWLKEYFKSSGFEEYYKTSDISVPNVELISTGESNDSKKTDDLINTKSIYSNYKDKITPLQATDPLLWSALCHITYKQYVLKRWKKSDDSVSIYKRFFATEGRSSLVYYNAISRLWWSGYLTFDEDKKSSNPWYLTDILFSAQQIQKDLFDQPFSMNKSIVKGLLLALKRIQDERGNSCTPLFRQCCHSYLNHYGVVSVLDYLDASEIESLAYNYMAKHTNEEFDTE